MGRLVVETLGFTADATLTGAPAPRERKPAPSEELGDMVMGGDGDFPPRKGRRGKEGEQD